MKVIDVSNYSGTDITPLIEQESPDGIIVRMKIQGERIPDGIAEAQMQTARDHGLAVGIYVWCYGSDNPERLVVDVANFATREGLVFDSSNPATSVLWLDCEDEVDPPTMDWVQRVVTLLQSRGYVVGIYTSKGWWATHGDSSFGNLPLWLAYYDNDPTLNDPLPNGWTTEQGSQYKENPDISNFIDSKETENMDKDKMTNALNVIWGWAQKVGALNEEAKKELQDAVVAIKEEVDL